MLTLGMLFCCAQSALSVPDSMLESRYRFWSCGMDPGTSQVLGMGPDSRLLRRSLHLMLITLLPCVLVIGPRLFCTACRKRSNSCLRLQAGLTARDSSHSGSSVIAEMQGRTGWTGCEKHLHDPRKHSAGPSAACWSASCTPMTVSARCTGVLILAI